MSTLNPKEANTNLAIIFFLWPVLALIESIRNYRTIWAKNGLWLFIIFFGYTFVSREGHDSSRYILGFLQLHRSDINFSLLKNMLYSESSSYVDVFQPVVTFIVSRFTDDHRVLFAVFAFTFGFFYSRNIWYLIDKTKGKLNPYIIVLIVVLSLIVPFWYINGVRFWTAAQVLLYGSLQFLIDGKRRGLWISASSVFFHFSFVFPLIILLIYWIIGNKTSLLLAFFLVSLVISEINIPVFREYLMAYTPDIIHNRILSYTSEAYIEGINIGMGNLNWYIIWYHKALNIALQILLFVVFFRGRTVWVNRRGMTNLFSFLLLFNGFANILSHIPSGGRFVIVGSLFSVSFLFLYFYLNQSEKLSRIAFLLLSPAYILFFIVTFRIGFQYIGLNLFFTDPFIAPFLENEKALIDFIK